MPHGQRHRSPKVTAALPRGVRRALDCMRTQPAHPFRIDELASIAGVTTRTLQRQFRAFLGKTPLSALRDIRLDFARRELLRGSPNSRVTKIALRFGFTHVGRFSIEYHRRYGESPSQTLYRCNSALPPGVASPRTAFVTRDRPTLAVLPIAAGASSTAIIAEITRELAAALTRAGITVVGSPQSAQYHLSGSLRENGAHASITFHLVEASSGRHLSAHRYDGVFGDGLLAEERIATIVTAAIQPYLRTAEIERANRKIETDLTAYELTMKALPHVLALEAGSLTQAMELLERAMDRDPDYPLALALAAWCHSQRIVYQFTERPEADRTSALNFVQRAMSHAADSTTLAVLGNALTAAHELEKARFVTEKALSFDGASAWAWSRSGWIDVYDGRLSSAMERFAIALELAPHDPLVFNSFVGLGCAHFSNARYDEAAVWLERAITERPSAVWAHRILCPAYAQSGRKSEAQRSLECLRQHYPDLTASQVTAAIPLVQSARSCVAEGLASVGAPP